VFSAISDIRGPASSRKSIFHRDRTRHRIDDFDQPQPNGASAECASAFMRDKEEIGEVAGGNAKATLGRSTLTATGFA